MNWYIFLTCIHLMLTWKSWWCLVRLFLIFEKLSLKTCCECCWILKRWNYLEVKCLFLHGLGFVWGWSDFVPSNFDLFVFNMADSLSRKIYRRNAFKANFQKTLEEARCCISDTRAKQAKYLGLQNNINRSCKSLNEIDDEESDVFESMGIMEPVHEILTKITLKLENMIFKDWEREVIIRY